MSSSDQSSVVFDPREKMKGSEESGGGGEEERRRLQGEEEETDLRTWHINNQDIPSTAYSKRKQVLAALCATMGCLLNGSVIGYTGPAIPSLLSTNSTSVWGNTTPVTFQEASWLTGLLSIGCFVGCVMAGPVMEKIGRKKSLMFVAGGFYILGFLLISLASRVELLYAGRFMNGAGLGVVLATVSVYIVEIATTDMRGFLGCFLQFQGSLGVLLTFVIGQSIPVNTSQYQSITCVPGRELPQLVAAGPGSPGDGDSIPGTDVGHPGESQVAHHEGQRVGGGGEPQVAPRSGARDD